MEDGGLTTGEAAERLGTTKPTIVNLIRRGELIATRSQHGTRQWWIVQPESVAEFLGKFGPFRGRRRRLPPVGRQVPTPGTESAAERERDELRTRVVALEDALAKQRSVTELLRQADIGRATVIEHLLAAAQAAEDVDELRRRALAELEEAMAGFTRPGNVAGLV